MTTEPTPPTAPAPAEDRASPLDQGLEVRADGHAQDGREEEIPEEEVPEHSPTRRGQQCVVDGSHRIHTASVANDHS